MQNCKTDDDDDDDDDDGDDGDYGDYVDYEVDKGSLLAIFMFNTFQNTRSRAWCVHTSVGSSVALLIARTKHVNCHVVSTCAVFLPQFLVLACCAGALFTAEVLCS